MKGIAACCFVHLPVAARWEAKALRHRSQLPAVTGEDLRLWFLPHLWSSELHAQAQTVAMAPVQVQLSFLSSSHPPVGDISVADNGQRRRRRGGNGGTLHKLSQQGRRWLPHTVTHRFSFASCRLKEPDGIPVGSLEYGCTSG